MSEQSESEDDRRQQEMIIMDDRPHIDGLTRGTVVEYDGWQWGVVTEIAEETEPTKVGFVLVDELGDWVVRELEDARGCWEHYEAVRTFRDGEHEYWTSAEYIQQDDMWEVLGPIHPDARDDEKLVTDGGRDTVEAEADRGDDVVVAHSEGDRIVAKANGGVVEGDWKTMRALGMELLSEAEKHKTDFQKAKEMGSGAHIRLSCDNCDIVHEAEYARKLTETPQEHADFPDSDCTIDDVSIEAFCPRHGTIPLSYDECDTCASDRALMNR